MTIWSWANWVVQIFEFQNFILMAQNIMFWCGPAPKPLGMSKDHLKTSKTLILTYKYSSYVSTQNPN